MDSQRGSDAELTKQFRNGDRDAFASLYRVHSPAVFRFALHMTADHNAAADITQEVFVWLIHHPAEFDPERGRLDAFLCGVARNMLRRRTRTERRWLPLDEVAEPLEAEDALRRHAEALDAAVLHRTIAALPERYREAVVLCDLENKTYDEAAAILGCPTGTVRSRLHRGRELLALRLRPARVKVEKI